MQKNTNGFGDTANVGIYSGLVFDADSILGHEGRVPPPQTDDVARLYRTKDLEPQIRPTWTQVFEGPAGSIRVDILGELNGDLYISHVSPNGMVILRSPTGTRTVGPRSTSPAWTETSATAAPSWTAARPSTVTFMWASPTPPPAWKSGARTAALIPNSTLLRWEQVGGSGLGDRNTIYAELIPFNGNLYAWTSNYFTGQEVRRLEADATCPTAKYVILMIADGWGYNPIEAANLYVGSSPDYQRLGQLRHVHLPLGRQLQPRPVRGRPFLMSSPAHTDSAAAATALYTGIKTANGRISVDSSGNHRLYAITEKARLQSKAVGAVTTVQISHATPGAWMAHNDARANGYAIADEGLWGDPATTGASTTRGTAAHTAPPSPPWTWSSAAGIQPEPKLCQHGHARQTGFRGRDSRDIHFCGAHGRQRRWGQPSAGCGG